MEQISLEGWAGVCQWAKRCRPRSRGCRVVGTSTAALGPSRLQAEGGSAPETRADERRARWQGWWETGWALGLQDPLTSTFILTVSSTQPALQTSWGPSPWALPSSTHSHSALQCRCSGQPLLLGHAEERVWAFHCRLWGATDNIQAGKQILMYTGPSLSICPCGLPSPRTLSVPLLTPRFQTTTTTTSRPPPPLHTHNLVSVKILIYNMHDVNLFLIR